MKNTHHRSESGQAVVLLAVMMVVLLGMAGLAIDGGNLYAHKRHAQNAVDNATLAYEGARKKLADFI
ncbi:MAG: Tad domain-containing protein, partial [Chloroflexota bacterium]